MVSIGIGGSILWLLLLWWLCVILKGDNECKMNNNNNNNKKKTMSGALCEGIFECALNPMHVCLYIIVYMLWCV